MNLVPLLLLGTASLGLAESLNGHFLKKYKSISSIGLLVVGSLMTLFLSTLVIIFSKQATPLISIRDLCLILFVGLLYYRANKLFYNSFKVQEASTSTILVMSSIVVTTLFGRIVFNEKIELLQWLGVLLILGAVVLTNIGGFSLVKLKNILKPTKVTKQVLLAAVLYGLANSTSKLIVQNVSPMYYQFLDSLLVTPFILAIDWKEVREQSGLLIKTGAYKILALVIPFYFVYNLIKYIVYNGGMPLPLVDSVDNSVVFVIIALEFLLFKIKPDNVWFKIITTVVAVSGVLLISLS